MTTLTPTPERLNTGPRGVCVRSWATLRGKTNLKPWYAKRYKRAVMQGAGVYLLGLWDVVMGQGRKAISHNILSIKQREVYEGFYLKDIFESYLTLSSLSRQQVNIARGLNIKLNPWQVHEMVRVFSLLGSKRGHLSKQKKVFNRGKIYFIKRYKNKGKRKVEVITKANKLKRMIFYRFKDQKFSNFWLSNNIKYRKIRINKLINILESKDKTPEGFKKLLSYLKARADLYRAFLSRIVKTHKRPARIPRPIHARPRPPAAPLAPPAFA